MLYAVVMTNHTTPLPMTATDQVLAESGLTGHLADAARAEMMYIWNCTGGRPSDAMRSAVAWVRRGEVASPVAKMTLAIANGDVDFTLEDKPQV